MKLREYQRKDVKDIWSRLVSEGRALLCRPTGTGKTVSAAALIRKLQKEWPQDCQYAIFVHSKDLLVQWMTSLIEAGVCREPNPTLPLTSQAEACGIFMYRRRSAQKTVKKVDLAIVDEGHRACSKVYLELIDSMRSDAWLLGLTATPFRMEERADGENVQYVFGPAIGSDKQTLDFIQEGHLAPVKTSQWGEFTYFDCYLDGMRTRNKELSEAQMAKELKLNRAPLRMAQAWKRYTPKGRGLVVTAGVQVAEETVKEMRKRGLKASLFAGSMLQSVERERVIEEFKARQTDILVTCGALQDGFDDSEIDTIMFGRPCFSKGLAIQFLGRALRLSKRKKRKTVAVLDCCAVFTRHLDVLEPLNSLCGENELRQPLIPVHAPFIRGKPRKLTFKEATELRVKRGIFAGRGKDRVLSLVEWLRDHEGQMPKAHGDTQERAAYLTLVDMRRGIHADCHSQLDELRPDWNLSPKDRVSRRRLRLLELAQPVDGVSSLSLEELALELGVTATQISYDLRDLGLVARGCSADAVRERIRKAACAVDGQATVTNKEIAKKVGRSPTTVAYHLRKLGISVYSGIRAVAAEREEQVRKVARVRNGVATVPTGEIMRKTGLSRMLVMEAVARLGIKTNNHRS